MKYDKYKKNEEDFKLRKGHIFNINLIDKLNESEKDLKETINSCLQLKSPPLKNEDFLKVLNYIKYEKVKEHYERVKDLCEKNQEPQKKYESPKQNVILDDLLKSIADVPSNILKAFRCIRTVDSQTKGKVG